MCRHSDDTFLNSSRRNTSISASSTAPFTTPPCTPPLPIPLPPLTLLPPLTAFTTSISATPSPTATFTSISTSASSSAAAALLRLMPCMPSTLRRPFFLLFLRFRKCRRRLRGWRHFLSPVHLLLGLTFCLREDFLGSSITCVSCLDRGERADAEIHFWRTLVFSKRLNWWQGWRTSETLNLVNSLGVGFVRLERSKLTFL